MRELKVLPPRSRKMPDQLYVASVTYADETSNTPVALLYGNNPRLLEAMVESYNILVKQKKEKPEKKP